MTALREEGDTAVAESLQPLDANVVQEAHLFDLTHEKEKRNVEKTDSFGRCLIFLYIGLRGHLVIHARAGPGIDLKRPGRRLLHKSAKHQLHGLGDQLRIYNQIQQESGRRSKKRIPGHRHF
jgi:hypothetical protein